VRPRRALPFGFSLLVAFLALAWALFSLSLPLEEDEPCWPTAVDVLQKAIAVAAFALATWAVTAARRAERKAWLWTTGAAILLAPVWWFLLLAANTC
jgi:hypothetical protein